MLGLSQHYESCRFYIPFRHPEHLVVGEVATTCGVEGPHAEACRRLCLPRSGSLLPSPKAKNRT